MTILGLALASSACLFSERPAMAQSPAPPRPPFLLVGVIMPEAGEPMAILEDPRTHEQELHTLGAQIDGVHLTRILKDRVILTSEGVAVEVRLAAPPPSSRGRVTPGRLPPSRARRAIPR
jgi:type II secretory pathway component PulC